MNELEQVASPELFGFEKVEALEDGRAEIG